MLAATLRQKSARDDGVGAHTVSEADDLDTSAAEAASGSLHCSRGSRDSPDRSERLKLRPDSFPTFWLNTLSPQGPLFRSWATHTVIYVLVHLYLLVRLYGHTHLLCIYIYI